MIDLEIIITNSKEALERGMPEEALDILDNQLIENSSDALFLKGEIYFKLQRWGEALNQFSRLLEKSPADSKAQSYCLMIQNILGYYHKDMYNP